MQNNKMSKTKFCKVCKIGISTFNRIMNNKNFNLISLFKIAKTINVRICELFT